MIATPLIRYLPEQRPADWASWEFVLAFLIGFAALFCALLILIYFLAALIEIHDDDRTARRIITDQTFNALTDKDTTP